MFHPIFPSHPNHSPRIIRPKLQEILSVDGKQPASVRRRVVGFSRVCAFFLLALRQLVLLVQQAPLEDAAEVVALRIHRPILKVLVVDAIDDWHRHDLVVEGDRSDERHQPVLVDLAVRVQVDDDLATCLVGAPRSRPDETLALHIPDDAHLAIEPLHVAVELVAEVALVAEVIDQQDLGEVLWRAAVDDAVNGSHEHGEALVVEHDDHADGGQLLGVIPLAAFLWSRVLDGAVQRDLVGDKHVHAVLDFGVVRVGARRWDEGEAALAWNSEIKF
jgi:hypothetical protein